jgi:AcrR family transcriptional regulator
VEELQLHRISHNPFTLRRCGIIQTVREWIPISSSAKGRLALHALEDFGQKGFEAVNVVDIAAAAGVTTGSLYHHFGSKVGLYTFVRAEAERRLLDRMEGAAAATRARDGRAAAVRAALLIGFDFATGQGFMRLLGEAHPARRVDPIVDLLAELCDDNRTPIARMLTGAWRAALAAVAEGTSVEAAREALAAVVTVDEAVLR